MPSSEPRIRRSGQVPSWTPATMTRSHSRPLAPVRGEDGDGIALRAALGQRVAGDLLAGQAVEEEPRRAGRQPGAEPGWPRRTARRRHRGPRRPRRPALPPAALAACQASARPEAYQTAQSTSWAVPPAAACLASASSAATRRAAAIGDAAAGPAAGRPASPGGPAGRCRRLLAGELRWPASSPAAARADRAAPLPAGRPLSGSPAASRGRCAARGAGGAGRGRQCRRAGR